MRADRFPKVTDIILAEALRQLIPLAEKAARDINEKWAVGAVQRADLFLAMWARQEHGRIKQLGGPIPETARGFVNVVDNPDHPDPGQIIPQECERSKRGGKAKQTQAAPK